MNTHDIELPPLPLTTGHEPDCPYPDWVDDLLRSYGTRCVEADRKRRGHPIAWVKLGIVENQFINMRPRRVWWECNEGVGVAIYTAPQPADLVAWPKINGVGRDAEHDQSLVIYFDSAPTDDQLRAVYEFLKDPQPAEPETEPASCTEEDGCPKELAVLQRFWRENQRTKPVAATLRCRRCGESANVAISSAHVVTHWSDGTPRDPRDIASDPAGKLVHDPDESLRAAEPVKVPSDEEIDALWAKAVFKPMSHRWLARALLSRYGSGQPATSVIPVPTTKEEYIALLDMAIELGKKLNIAWEDAFRATKGQPAASAEPVGEAQPFQPGVTAGAFTHCVFDAKSVPAGTKLYATPVTAQAPTEKPISGEGKLPRN